MKKKLPGLMVLGLAYLLPTISLHAAQLNCETVSKVTSNSGSRTVQANIVSDSELSSINVVALFDNALAPQDVLSDESAKADKDYRPRNRKYRNYDRFSFPSSEIDCEVYLLFPKQLLNKKDFFKAYEYELCTDDGTNKYKYRFTLSCNLK